MLGGGATAPPQQVVALGGSQQQQQQQQTLVRVKSEQQQLTDQSRLHHLEQQQLLIPKREMKSEDGIAHQLQRQELQLQMHMRQQQQQQQSQQINSAQFNSLLQQQRLLQQQQQQQELLHSHHQLQSQSTLQLQPHQHELQLQQQQHGSNLQTAAQAKQSTFEPGVCSQRLMQYMYHQRRRPLDNNIVFWRKFVNEYFAPRAKKRWCVSLYGSGGQQPTGVFQQDVWQCEICGTKPGRGFETTVEVLPRLCKIKYDSGISEELLFVDLANEYRLSSGQLVLEYEKVIQESVFDQLRVVRNGQLRIIFSPDLKIMSWEFCARSHEELLPRRLMVPQVTSLAAIAQKYQTSASQNGGSLSLQEMQTNCSLFVTSARQLARNLEVPMVNDMGYTKRYVRCLQISEVVNSMKDLIDFSQDNNIGPIDSLLSFPRQSSGGFVGNQVLLQQQQQEQQQQQQEQLELQNLIAQTSPNNTLSSLQQQLDAGSAHMGNTNSLSSSSSLIHELPGVSNPLTSFLHRNSLTSSHDPLQGGSLQNARETNFSNSCGGGRGGGLHHSHQQQQHQQTLPPQQQRQQQQSFGGVGGGSHSGGASHQNSPTNSISSLQNSLSSFSGTGLAGSLLNWNLLSAGALQQNSAAAVGMASLLEQQQQQQSLQLGQQGSQQQQHQDTQNVVNHLLQEMMMNQQHMNRATSSSFQQQALGAVSGLDGGNQGIVNAATQGFSGSMNSFTVTAAGGGAAHTGTGALSNSSIGGGGSGPGGGGVNTTVLAAAAGLGNNYSLRNSESGFSSLGGLVSGGNVAAGAAAPINTLNGRLMLAGIGQQQQQQQMQDLSHPSHHHHHHELAGTVSGLLGDGLSTASGFAATQFNWSKTP
ncbi:hypothetical protein CY35_18G030000 [Sphagnum magellanicum]|nr:hypothetical protein CY35_18G030000 [Sphagnum magellanicum]